MIAAVNGEIPVVAAGGFRDGAGLAADLAWGADGIAMGTRFLLTETAVCRTGIKRRYLEAGLSDTIVSKAIDGAPQRALRTPFVERLERSSLLSRLPRAAAAGYSISRRMGIGPMTVLRTAHDMRINRNRP